MDRVAIEQGDGAATGGEDVKESKRIAKPAVQHDYTQYYPTNLPFCPPPFLRELYPPEDEEEDEGGAVGPGDRGSGTVSLQAGSIGTTDLAMTKVHSCSLLKP
jgi:hypothetical protein